MNHHAMVDLYENLLRSIADPFFIISEEGTYLDVFGGTERSLYDDPQTLKGKNIYDFMEVQFAQSFMQEVKRTLRNNMLHSFEYQLAPDTVQGIPKTGPMGMQWYEARLFPLASLYDNQRAVTALILNITERKQMQQKLRELSYQDPLTLVANRRYFFEHLHEQLDVYMQNMLPLAVMVLDIDHFKLINDTYGHFAGDQILKQLVTIIRQVVRCEDIVARFGGDEFIISLEGLPLPKVMEMAEEIRIRVEQGHFIVAEDSFLVTISIGIADVTIFDTEIESIVSRADKALYIAKSQGRNKVIYL